VGCATTETPPPAEPAFQPVELSTTTYDKKVDIFVVVLDSSSSMRKKSQGYVKFYRAKEIVNRINQTVPPLDYNAGMVVFGGSSCLDNANAKVVYGLVPYNQVDLKGALDSLKCTGGSTPLADGIDATQVQLKDNIGSVALILVSDFKDVNQERALGSVRALMDVHGDLCVYPVQVGDDPKGTKLAADLAAAGGCGFATNAEAIASASAMGDYVTKVLLAPAAAAPAAAAMDSDGDGVADTMDQCPNTPKGATVNEYGCWAYQGEVLFDFDQAELKAGAYPILDEAVMVLNNNPDLKIEIQGYTDSTGEEDYNVQLSQRRAESVMSYLVSRGIDPARLTAKGYGSVNPVASNDTPQGRAKNRRVEFRASTQ
jgi:OOP family OmpA-OmpF porin